MPLSPDFVAQERLIGGVHESIRPAGNGHGFHYIPAVRRGNLSPAGEDGETSSEEEEEDGTPEPHPQRHYLANSGNRQYGYPVKSDTEIASDSSSDDESAPRRSEIHESQTPRSRSRTSTYSGRNVHTPPRHNFTLSEIRPHSLAEDDFDTYSDDDDLSIIYPSRYSDAASSPPRESWAGGVGGVNAQVHYPSPPPTDRRGGDELAEDFENLDCNHHKEEEEEVEREKWLRRKRQIARAKRMSSGSIHKRTLSMSIGSDTDDEDVRTEAGYEEQATEMGGSASGLRRLRRKTLEGGNRGCLMFDDPPQRIVECEEPESEAERHDTWSPPRRIPDVAMGYMMDELPYWRGEEMEY